MDKSEKEAVVSTLHDKMSRANFVAAVKFSQLDANTAIELRRAMRKGGVEYKVVKNTLALRASKGTAAEKLEKAFEGPVAVAIGYDDVVGTAKVITEFFKKASDKLQIKAAVVEGEHMEASGVEALSKLPGLPEVRAQLLAMFNTPATTLARLLNTPGGQVARVLQARVDKEGAPEAA